MLNRTRARALLFAVVLGMLVVPAALAATVESGGDYVVNAGQVVTDDVYAFAQEVRIEGTIQGDLVAFASKITIAQGGRVEGDLQGAAQDVLIEGTVGDDVRAAGFEVKVAGTGSVGSDLLAAGYSVECETDTTVGGDIYAASYQGIFDGIVDGDVRYAGAAMEINGQIGGDVRAEVEAPSEKTVTTPNFGMFGMPEVTTISPGLKIGDTASIAGTLVYTAPEASSLPAGVAASTDFSKSEKTEATKKEERSAPVQWLIDAVKAFVALLVVGIVLLLILPRAMAAAEAIASTRPLPGAGMGCLTLILALVGLIVLAFVTILVLIIAGVLHVDPLILPVLAASFLTGTLLTSGVYLLVWAGRIVVSLWIGRRLFGLGSERWSGSHWLPLLLGVAIYAVLWTIPYGGKLLDLVGVIIGLGSIVIGVRAFAASRRMPPLPPATSEPQTIQTVG